MTTVSEGTLLVELMKDGNILPEGNDEVKWEREWYLGKL